MMQAGKQATRDQRSQLTHQRQYHERTKDKECYREEIQATLVDRQAGATNKHKKESEPQECNRHNHTPRESKRSVQISRVQNLMIRPSYTFSLFFDASIEGVKFKILHQPRANTKVSFESSVRVVFEKVIFALKEMAA